LELPTTMTFRTGSQSATSLFFLTASR
jgi:hypothetical protein